METPPIRVAWERQGEVSVGRQCTCALVLTNPGSAAVRNVEVTAVFSRNVRLLGADPAPARSSEFLVWELAELAAGSTQRLQVTMVPLAPGEISTQAEVRFSTAVAGSFQVAEPKLALKLSGPQQALLGDSASQTITISNPGTGVAGNVQIAAVIPPGLEHVRGGQLVMDLGALHPGETRSVRLPLAAVAGGRHVVQVEARADGGLVQQATCEVAVVAPHIAAGIDGPSLRYLGRRATYTLRITNDGSVPADNVRVMHKVPEGMTFVAADQGAQFDEGTRLVSWFVGRLEQGQTAVREVTFECERIGEFRHFVRASSEQGSVSDAQIATTVEGTPLLSLSVRDLDDPVEIGVETAYEVQVKNEGSAAARNVQLSCELPEGMILVDVAGPTQHRQERNSIVCAPLAQLRPGETATVRVRVKSAAAGHARFRAKLTSESVEAPLIQEELTKFYGE